MSRSGRALAAPRLPRSAAARGGRRPARGRDGERRPGRRPTGRVAAHLRRELRRAARRSTACATRAAAGAATPPPATPGRTTRATRASDWFFFNIPEDNPNPATLPDGSSADRFVDDDARGGSRAAADRADDRLDAEGPRQAVGLLGGEVRRPAARRSARRPAGSSGASRTRGTDDGRRAARSITGNDPADTSAPSAPRSSRTGCSTSPRSSATQGTGGVRYYALDNEPALWNSTHHDVLPQPLTYDELWTRTPPYAAAIKPKDPAALVFGPADWGWCAYFFSAADDCSVGAGPHGARQPRAPRLVPEAGEAVPRRAPACASSTSSTSTTTRRRRGRALGRRVGRDAGAAAPLAQEPLRPDLRRRVVDRGRAPGGIVRLIPRMRDWIARALPGHPDSRSPSTAGAATTARAARSPRPRRSRSSARGRRPRDALGRAGRRDARRGRVPALPELRRRRRARARATACARRARTSDQVGAYAIVSPSNVLYVLLFNKDTVARTVTVSVAGGVTGTFGAVSASPRRAASRAPGSATPAGGVLSLTLPARSATLAVGASALRPRPAPTRFYTLTPCRAFDTRNAAGEFGGPALAAARRSARSLSADRLRDSGLGQGAVRST